MTKFRIYEIAKEINVDSKEIVSFLKGRNIAVKSNLSSVDEGVRQTVLKEMGRKGNGPKPRKRFRRLSNLLASRRNELLPRLLLFIQRSLLRKTSSGKIAARKATISREANMATITVMAGRAVALTIGTVKTAAA